LPFFIPVCTRRVERLYPPGGAALPAGWRGSLRISRTRSGPIRPVITSSIALVAYQVIHIDDMAAVILYKSFLQAGSIFGLDQ